MLCFKGCGFFFSFSSSSSFANISFFPGKTLRVDVCVHVKRFGSVFERMFVCISGRLGRVCVCVCELRPICVSVCAASLSRLRG